jgi:hypothetical protein
MSTGTYTLPYQDPKNAGAIIQRLYVCITRVVGPEFQLHIEARTDPLELPDVDSWSYHDSMDEALKELSDKLRTMAFKP